MGLDRDGVCTTMSVDTEGPVSPVESQIIINLHADGVQSITYTNVTPLKMLGMLRLAEAQYLKGTNCGGPCEPGGGS